MIVPGSLELQGVYAQLFELTEIYLPESITLQTYSIYIYYNNHLYFHVTSP